MKTTVNKTTKEIAESIATKILAIEKPKYFRREIEIGFEIYTKSLNMETFLKDGTFVYDELIAFKYTERGGRRSFRIDDILMNSL